MAMDLFHAGLYVFLKLLIFELFLSFNTKRLIPVLSAYVLINTEAGKEKEVLNSLNSNDSVVDVSIVYGQYDLIAKVFLDDASDLPSFIMETIRPIGGITGTSTLLAAYDSSRA